MKIESVKIGSLTLDPDNARKHSAKNIKAIAGSLETFGQRRPLVVWGDVVIAGNGTIEAAKSIGWTEIQITRVPEDWTQDRARAYALADNRTAELAEWDGESLLDILSGLNDELVAAAGFTSDEIDDLTKLWGDSPSLDDLLDEYGDPTDEDGLIVVRFKVTPADHEKWNTAMVATGQKDMEAVSLLIQVAYDALTDGSM
jgi:hypothetical protein